MAESEHEQLVGARASEHASAEQWAAAQGGAHRAAVAAHAAEDGLLSARAAEAAAGQAHAAAQQHAAAESQRLEAGNTNLGHARSRELELRERSGSAHSLAREAEVEVVARLSVQRDVSHRRAAHEASPRRHKVTMMDHYASPGSIGYDSPQTMYQYAHSPGQAADQAIVGSPHRVRAGALF